jgi:hypothetical protein
MMMASNHIDCGFKMSCLSLVTQVVALDLWFKNLWVQTNAKMEANCLNE